MLWYEPCGSPADWAIRHANDIDSLVKNWDNCKYNPSVLRAFIMDEDFNWNKFAIILSLYDDHTKFKDLLLICFEKLKIFINGQIEWKFSKISEEDKEKCKSLDGELLSIWLQISFLCNGEPTQIIVNNYPDISDYLRNFTRNAIVSLYKRQSITLNPDAVVNIDDNYADNIIKEIINIISKNTNSDNIVYDFEGSPFVYFVCNLLKREGMYETLAFDVLFDVVDEYHRRNNRDIVSRVCPHCQSNVINDIYDTINCVANRAEVSDMLIALLSDKALSTDKNELCKITKLCINNANHFYDNCISKSCEESIIEGIKNFVDPIVPIGIFDIDECLTAIEAITYDIEVVTEANRYEYSLEDEPQQEEEEPQEEPQDEAPEEERISRKERRMLKKAAKKKNEKVKRDFDADYRKFKKNVRNVDISLTKILSTVKGYLTGTSDARGIRKATGVDSISNVLARVFGTVAVFHVNKFLGLLFIVVRLANSNKVTSRERAKIISEIKVEIDVLDTQLNDGSIESAEARRDLLRTKRNLEDALRKIETHRTRGMTEGSKQAIRDIVDRR